MWKEFFQDPDGAGSMSRFIMFGTFVIAAIVIIGLLWQTKLTEGFFIPFLGIPSLAYGMTKAQETKVAAITNTTPPQ